MIRLPNVLASGLAAALVALIAPVAMGQQPLGTNLLTNGDFETGDLSGWAAVSSIATAVAYGSADVPVASVATLYGGGTTLVRSDTNTTSVIEQVFDVSGNAADIDAGNLALTLRGVFGEGPTSLGGATMRVRFLNGSGGQLGIQTMGGVTVTNLNGTLSALTREDTFAVPANTRQLDIELSCPRSNNRTTYADNLSAVLDVVSAPAAAPLDTELLPNTDFEAGVIFDPVDPNTWVINSNPGFAIVNYGDPNVPDTTVAAVIGGGTSLLRRAPSTFSTASTMTRFVDVRGNAGDIDAGLVSIRVSGYFGESANFGGSADLQLRFRNDIGSQIGFQTVGNVTPTQMNGEITALFREETILLPVDTREIEITITLSSTNAAETCYIDNASAMLVTTPGIPAPLPLDTELLVQNDFEDGLIIDPNNQNGWRVESSPGLEVVPYGSPGVPLTTDGLPGVSAGSLIRRATGATFSTSSSMEQVFDVSGNAAQIDQGGLFLVLSGNFGESGSFGGGADLLARFRNDVGTQLGLVQIGNVTQANNNGEVIASARNLTSPVPFGTREIEITLAVASNTAGEAAFADNLSARLTDDGSTAPQPIGAELINDGEFESGLIVNPLDPDSWVVTTNPGFQRLPYGGASVPSPAVSTQIGGGTFLIAPVATTFSNTASMRQRIDVSGNAAAIDQGDLDFEVIVDSGDSATGLSFGTTITVRFQNAAGTTTQNLFVEETNFINQNSQVTMFRRRGRETIPAGTRRIEVQVGVSTNATTGEFEFADRISAVLIPSGSDPVLPDIQLVANGDFEDTNVVTAGALDSWFVQSGEVEVVDYGLADTPSTAVASAVGGGNSLLRVAATSTTTGPVVNRIIDVRENAVEIDAGDLGIHVEALLGGLGSDNDRAQVDVDFLAANLSQLGTMTLGPVTATDRNSVTDMLFREGDFLVPVGTRSVRIEIRFITTDPNRTGFVDNVVIRFDNDTFPGSREDLQLATGINGPVSAGPFDDFKTAAAGDIIVLNMSSPMGTHDFQPLTLITQVFGAGSFPGSPGGFPNTYINPFVPGLFVLLDGGQNFGVFGPPIVIPGGTILQLQTPTGLGGFEAIFQSLVVTPGASNGFFVTSNAHVVTF